MFLAESRAQAKASLVLLKKSADEEVNGADVTLTGEVHSWSERDLARHSAWGTAGVRNVVDNMTVGY